MNSSEPLKIVVKQSLEPPSLEGWERAERAILSIIVDHWLNLHRCYNNGQIDNQRRDDVREDEPQPAH